MFHIRLANGNIETIFSRKLAWYPMNIVIYLWILFKVFRCILIYWWMDRIDELPIFFYNMIDSRINASFVFPKWEILWGSLFSEIQSILYWEKWHPYKNQISYLSDWDKWYVVKWLAPKIVGISKGEGEMLSLWPIGKRKPCPLEHLSQLLNEPANIEI